MEFDKTTDNKGSSRVATDGQSPLPPAPVVEYAWSDGRKRPPLPIDKHLSKIAALLESNRVVIVEGEPGCGKTLRLGQMLALNAIQKARTSGVPVVPTYLTQTRRNALRWNYATISKEMGSIKGDPVGFEIRGQKSLVGANSALILRIDKSMANQIARQGGRLPDGVIVIDEAHENSLSMTLLVGIVKAGLVCSPETKIVLTSATLNASKLSEFFDDAPIVTVSGQDFAVASRVERLRTNQNEHHTQAAARVARDIMDSFVARTLSADGPGGAKAGEGLTRGTIVLLLPGKEDLLNVETELVEYATQLRSEASFEVIRCHGSSEPSVQDQVQSPLANGTLRFVLGTEILRTSVTVSGVVGVVDSLQMKREFVSDSGAQELRKVAVSEIDVKQGRGRVGRQAPGFYIAVSHEDEYENLRPAPLPVTHTGALSDLILQAALADLDIHNFPFVAAPDWARVERDRLLLQRLGALDESFRITELGSKLAALPLEPRSAVALLKGKELGVAPAVAVAVSVLEAGEYFLLPHRTTEKWVVSEAIASILKKAWTAECVTQQPFEEGGVSDLPFPWLVEIEGSKFGSRFEVDVTHAEFPYRRDPWRWIASVVRSDWANQSGSDFVAAVYAYQMYVAAASKLGGDSSRHSWRKLIKYNLHLAQWCDENFLHYKGLQRVAETFRDLSHRWGEGLDGAFYSAEELLSRKSDPSRLSKALLAGYFDQFGVLLAQGRNLFRGLEESFVISHSSACPQRWPLVLAGRVRATNIGQFGSTVMQRYTEMCAPIELSWLEEIAPQHIEWEYAGPINYHRDKDSVRCERVTRFRGVVVRREEVVVGEPELSTPVFVRWMLLNRELLPEAVQEILQRNDSILANVRGIDRRLELGVEVFESGQSYHDWLVEKLSGRASCKVIRNDSSLLLLPARDLLNKTLRALAWRKAQSGRGT